MNKFVNARQMKALLAAHTKELLRQPEILFWGILFPILLTLGLGLAFTQKGDTTHRIAFIDNGRHVPDSRPNSFMVSLNGLSRDRNKKEYTLSVKDRELGNTNYIFQEKSWQEATALLKRGEISLVLQENNKGIEYHFDPMNPDAQLTYLKLSKIVGGMKTGSSPEPAGGDRIRPLTLSGTRYVDFLVPGLIAMGIMMSSVWGLSYGIIDKRSKKLLRRMVATPMKKSHYLISLMTVRTVMNFIEATLLFVFAHLFFGVNIQGSITALVLIFIASNIAFQGISIFISSRTSSTEVGNGFINAVTTPMMILSGIFFSYHNFPVWAIAFIKLLPLTILADSIRSIFIEGAGYYQVALPFIILITIGLVFFSFGLRMFRWH